MKYEKHNTACQPQNGLEVDSGWFNRMLNVLLPPCCVLCSLPSGSICICDGCKSDLPLPGPHCSRCGLPLGSKLDKICGACIQKAPPYTRTVFPLLYAFPVDQLVQGLKFRRQVASGRVLSHLMCEHIVKQELSLPDMLVPVPLHRLRLIKRGFNQAYELGAYAGRTLDIPLLGNALRRRRNTSAQSGLDRKQRLRNVRGAFHWNGWAKPGKHVALIDDVMTTGTTVGECARVLKRAGARRVDVWVAARAIPAGRE